MEISLLLAENPKEISNKIIELSGINIFTNSRKREFVEHRSLLCYLLREKLLMRWTNIAVFFEAQGKSMTHANAMYLVRNYDVFKSYNKNLNEIENVFIFKSKFNYDEIDQVHYLENKCNNLIEKNSKLDKQLNAPIVKLVNSIPEESIEKAYTGISNLIKSWKWKEKSNN